jgi:hypothetical protein
MCRAVSPVLHTSSWRDFIAWYAVKQRDFTFCLTGCAVPQHSHTTFIHKLGGLSRRTLDGLKFSRFILSRIRTHVSGLLITHRNDYFLATFSGEEMRLNLQIDVLSAQPCESAYLIGHISTSWCFINCELDRWACFLVTQFCLCGRSTDSSFEHGCRFAYTLVGYRPINAQHPPPPH